MKTPLHITIQKILTNYDYLPLNALTVLVQSEMGFDNEVKENTINTLILADIETNGIHSTFIKV
ncbi:MAG: hypothetical protein LBG52_04555 [Candidatus Peribacteria bacterium]|jgi:hypothetical protein|nr:hypothetical protein [Candidatus Peribacteria bacterium]